MKKYLIILILFIFISLSVFISYSVSGWFTTTYTINECPIEKSVWSGMTKEDKIKFTYKCLIDFKIIYPECNKPKAREETNEKDYVLYIECADEKIKKRKQQKSIIMKASYTWGLFFRKFIDILVLK